MSADPTRTLPQGWTQRRLRFDARANPVKSELALPGDTEVSFVPMDAVGELGGLRLDQTRELADVYNGYTYFVDGDVCIAKITPCFENGKGALSENLTNGVAFGTTELHVVRPSAGLDARFLFYLTIAHDFRSHGESEMLGAGGQKNPDVPMRPSGIDWIGDVPEHWMAAPVKRIAKLESGHTPDKKVDEYWQDCEIPWVSLNDTNALRADDYISDTAFKINELGLANSSARMLPPRAVVFTRDATIGESAITTRPMAVSQHIIAWLCDEALMIPEYLLFAIYGMTQELMRLTNGSTIGTIGLADVKSICVAVPPLEEQSEIVEYVFQEKNRMSTAGRVVQESIDALREYRSSLITAAVTGQLPELNG
jgi:hypothetical protein